MYLDYLVEVHINLQVYGIDRENVFFLMDIKHRMYQTAAK